jgi:diadenosine tetraphosphatase ApaH/serine/threonine PP2A family protein phosphatase
LRGSHDDADICRYYGLWDECKNKLNEDPDKQESVFNAICDLFNYLPLAATVNEKILCVHSGISENIKTLEEISQIKKPYKMNDLPIITDLLWSSPKSGVEYNAINFTSNLRKKYFDETIITEFLKNNKLNIVIRSHDVVDGFEKIFSDKVITVFSCTNYCGVQNNSGGIIFIKKTGEIQPKILYCEEGYTIWTYSNVKDYPVSPKRKQI